MMEQQKDQLHPIMGYVHDLENKVRQARANTIVEVSKVKEELKATQLALAKVVIFGQPIALMIGMGVGSLITNLLWWKLR